MMTRQNRMISAVLLVALMRRGLGVFLSCLLAGNSLASSVVEGSFWKERRQSVLAGARTHSRSTVSIALTSGWPAPGPSGLSGQTVDPLILETLPVQPVTGRLRLNNEPLFPALSKIVGSLSNEWGTVRSIALPPGPFRRIVVHIQDIHEHTEAQTHISRAVRGLLSVGAVDMVGLEGAFAPQDLEPFRRFPHRDTTEIVADDLLKRHVISGPVHGGMLLEQTSVPFVGVDDEIHHRQNVEAYRQSLRTRAENTKNLDEADRLLESRKAAVFSPALLKWDRALRAYREGKVGLAQHVESLSFHAPRLPPQLKILQKAVALEKKIDFARANQERAEVVKRLVQNLSEQTFADLAAQSAAFKAGRLSHGAFYGYLKRLCESAGLPWDSYSAFRDYVDYVLMAQSLRMDQVQKELLSAGQTTSVRLARSKEEKSLLAESEQLRLLSLLTTFTLTPTEWAEYKEQSFAKPLIALVSDRTVYESFYREAEQRDNAMSTRLLEAMGAGKNKTAVLVAGGFHSAGLRKLLTTQGTAVVEFVPRVTKIEPNSGSAYLSVFSQDKTPLDQLFTAEKLFVANSPMSPTAVFQATGEIAAVETSRGGLSPEVVTRHFLSNTFRSNIKKTENKLSHGKASVVFFFKKTAYRFTHFIRGNNHVFEEGALSKKGRHVRRPPFSFVTARFLARVLPWGVLRWIVRTGRVESFLTGAIPQYFAEVVYYLGLNTGLIYRSYTRPGRLAPVDNLMVHLGIGQVEGSALIYDVGPGCPPMTSYEMKKNIGARVVTYETGNPTYLVTLGTVGKNGESPLFVRFNEKSELLSVWRYGGNGGVGFNRFLLTRYLLRQYLTTGKQWNIGNVRKDPSLLSSNPKMLLERRAGNLFSGLGAPKGEYADVVRIANVLWFQNKEDELAAIEKISPHLRVGGKIYIVDGGAEQMEVFVYEKTENRLAARFYAVSCDPGNENRFEENLGTDRYGTRGWLFNSFAAQRKEISRITSELHKQHQWSPQAVADKLSIQFPGVTSVGNLYLFPLSAEGEAKPVPAQTPLTRRVWTTLRQFVPEGWRTSVQAEARFTAGWEFFYHWVFPSLLVYAATVGLGMVGISVSPENLIPALAPVWGIVFYNSHRERGPPLAGMSVYLTTLYGFGALFLSWGGGFVFLGVTLVAFGLAGHIAYDTKYIPLNSNEFTERDRQNMAELADETEQFVREKPNELPVLARLVDREGNRVASSARVARENHAHGATHLHAEAAVLRKAVQAGFADWEGATLYVNLEPCPKCATALTQFYGVNRVVYGIRDTTLSDSEHINEAQYTAAGSVLVVCDDEILIQRIQTVFSPFFKSPPDHGDFFSRFYKTQERIGLARQTEKTQIIAVNADHWVQKRQQAGENEEGEVDQAVFRQMEYLKAWRNPHKRLQVVVVGDSDNVASVINKLTRNNIFAQEDFDGASPSPVSEGGVSKSYTTRIIVGKIVGASVAIVLAFLAVGDWRVFVVIPAYIVMLTLMEATHSVGHYFFGRISGAKATLDFIPWLLIPGRGDYRKFYWRELSPSFGLNAVFLLWSLLLMFGYDYSLEGMFADWIVIPIFIYSISLFGLIQRVIGVGFGGGIVVVRERLGKHNAQQRLVYLLGGPLANLALGLLSLGALAVFSDGVIVWWEILLGPFGLLNITAGVGALLPLDPHSGGGLILRLWKAYPGDGETTPTLESDHPLPLRIAEFLHQKVGVGPQRILRKFMQNSYSPALRQISFYLGHLQRSRSENRPASSSYEVRLAGGALQSDPVTALVDENHELMSLFYQSGAFPSYGSVLYASRVLNRGIFWAATSQKAGDWAYQEGAHRVVYRKKLDNDSSRSMDSSRTSSVSPVKTLDGDEASSAKTVLENIVSRPVTSLGVGQRYELAQELARNAQIPQEARELKAALREKGVDVSNIEAIRDFFASLIPGRSQLFFVSRKDQLTEEQWRTLGATFRSRYRPGDVVLVVPPNPDAALRRTLTQNGLDSFVAVAPPRGYVPGETGGTWVLATVERNPLVRRALEGNPFVSLCAVPSTMFDKEGAVSENLSDAVGHVQSLWDVLKSFSIQRARLEIIDILARAVQQSA